MSLSKHSKYPLLDDQLGTVSKQHSHWNYRPDVVNLIFRCRFFHPASLSSKGLVKNNSEGNTLRWGNMEHHQSPVTSDLQFQHVVLKLNKVVQVKDTSIRLE